MKKVSMLLCLAVLLGNLAACTGADSGDPSVSQDTAADTASVSETDQIGSSGKEIVFWDAVWGGSEYTEAAKKLVDTYSAESGVNVVYQQIPWDGWLQTWSTAFASGTGPDVATGSALLQHRYFLSGDVEPLDDLAATYSADDFTNSALENFQYDGHQLAIPFNVDYRGIFYRIDRFEEAGITELPTNWDEFYETAKMLTTDGKFGYVFAGTDVNASWTGLFWAVNNGTSFLDDSMQPAFTAPGNVEAMDYLRRMFNEGIIPPGAPGYTGSDALKLFLQGDAAMLMYGPNLSNSITSEELADSIGVLPPIESPAGIDYNVGSANGLILFSKSVERGVRAEGVAFIDWWSKNTETLWTEGDMGAFPARLSLMENSHFQDAKYPKLFMDLVVPKTVLFCYPHPSSTVQMDIMDGEQFYSSIIQELLTTQTPTEEVMQNANARYQTSLDQLMSTINE